MLGFNKHWNITTTTVTALPFRLVSYASLSDYSPCRQLMASVWSGTSEPIISQGLIQQIVSDSERDHLSSVVQVYQSRRSFVYKLHNCWKINLGNLLHLNYRFYLNKEIMSISGRDDGDGERGSVQFYKLMSTISYRIIAWQRCRVFYSWPEKSCCLTHPTSS